ncbi:MAG: DUF115 domain-containing protein [Eubacterium sp.]|nr:DUF115 domain-containing protein [Eubacterium sp.]
MNYKNYIKYCISNAVTLLNGSYHSSKKYLKLIKNKHKGERCFIVGNGPSLTADDLEMLKNETTFASNRIYSIFDNTSWRPTYYAIFDGSVAEAEGVVDGINSIDCEMRFVRRQGYFKSYKGIKAPVCYVKSYYSRKYLDNPKFSVDASKGVYTIGSVTYAMIQLAFHMGFKEIYLIGMDNRYAFSLLRDGTVVENKNVTSHFAADQKRKATPVATWECDIAYEYANKFSKENGFKIYNATRGGYLEYFERINLDDVLS